MHAVIFLAICDNIQSRVGPVPPTFYLLRNEHAIDLVSRIYSVQV